MKDRSQLIGFTLIICAFVLMFKNAADQANQAKIANQKNEQTKIVYDEPVSIEAAGDFDIGVKNFTAVEKNTEVEKFFTLENDVIGVTISDRGGTIKSTALRKYQSVQDRPDVVAFNDGCAMHAMSLSSSSKRFSKFIQSERFDEVSVGKHDIVLSKTVPEGYTITRQYHLVPQDSKDSDGYVVEHKIHIENNTNSPLNIGSLFLFLGSMPATEGDAMGDYLNFGMFNGKKENFIKLRDFKESKGFFGFGKREERKFIFHNEKILWGAIKNQFFTTILTPEVKADGYITYPILVHDKCSNKQEEGIGASMIFNVGTIDGGKSKTFSSSIYMGPKDFSRLSKLGKEQDRVMQFGFFGSISELLLRLMLGIHAIIPNWGWTIIVLTTMVKLLLWPLTNAQVRSSKKMAAIQNPLKIIKEKYKNNPQKLQMETLKLFRENGINPAAGCLPIFIQIPIFFGLYYMLRTASDLRFAHFLWIKDLSLPDTVAHIGHFPVNILPLIMGVTMFWQMHMAPMPTSDNSQKLMFKLMPVIFFLCCYTFPSGLVLYWTVQNLLTIVQQFTMSHSSKVQEESNVKISTEKRSSRSPKRRKNNVRI
ncbi:MAG: membrane protein insertase YidC [Puniceicoccales bacterium]|jgi:YidC/Oxa1 family membrane protein insertase|nr:membrane protein insertase YidC [Puniceicoccales bacterium]